jgi:hypothetical protein
MASTNIKSLSLGGILIQSGNGVPDHISTKGTQYTDLDTAIEYINKDGVAAWYELLDSTYVFTGSTGSSFTGGTVSGATQFINGLTANTISATTYYGLPTDVYVSGATYSGGTAVFTNTTGGTFSVSGFSSGSSGTSLYWYSENATPPTTSPVATGSGSIAFGNGAEALGDDMFVYGYGAGNNTTNAIYSNFIGYFAGNGATDAFSSNFFGQNSGNQATGASNSNFIGFNAGNQATNANNSNFIGSLAGYGANNATSSNFFGYQAGDSAINAGYSNFLGYQAGYQATDASYSNFIGANAGYGATLATNSNFFGNQAGEGAIEAFYSNFIGLGAGEQATDANNSNFLGYYAGNGANGAYSSNFLGSLAGLDANSANNSNFFGGTAGNQATYADNSNFLGQRAGYGARNAGNSNFMGRDSGYQASGAQFSNFFGSDAGYEATNATISNFLGYAAGKFATYSNDSNFMGQYAGFQATNSSNSNFFGHQAGYQAGFDSGSAANSNFMGQRAGYGARNAGNSNFFGWSAGENATDANNSNFMGVQAGSLATGASNSNFFGQYAGFQANNAIYSNFFGYQSGKDAINAYGSNFIGTQAGYIANYATYSNFIGWNTGYGATKASYSNLFGFNVGVEFTNNSLGSNNIIIGSNISLPSGATDSINIGGVLFGTGTNSIISGNPFTVANSIGKIGINVVTPTEALHVSGNTLIQGNLSANTLNISTLGVGTSITNLGIDLLGNIVTGTIGGGGTFTGGTVTGPTTFTNGLTANTISATTYYGDGSNLTGISAVATEFVVNCRNQSGSNMYRGQVVYMNGSTGNKPTILLAQANYEMTSARAFGVLKNDIANNAYGDVVTIGSVTNLDTRTSATHPFTIDTLSDGQTIYLSPTNAGYITNIKPYAPNHLVYIGKVVRTSPTNGYIEYQIQNGYELDELHDVNVTGRTNGDILIYNSGTTLWENSKTLNGNYNVNGVLSATTFFGNGSNLTGITSFTGGTVSGVTNFTSSVTANTLNISTLGGGASIVNLGIDSLGNVVTGSSGSSSPRPISTIISSTTLSNIDQIVIVDSNSPITITLPQIISNGRFITIKNINIGVETLLPYSGQLIDGDTSVIVARKNVSLDLQSYNNNWYVI